MLRQELLNALGSVRGALGPDKSTIPVHCCFCFTGETIFSYDDTAALVVKLKTPWKGGVRGEALLSWLKACGAKEVEAEMDGTTLKLKCGRAHADFPVLQASEFLFDPPDLSAAPKLKLTSAVLGALRRSSLAMGVDGQHPWRLGVQAIILEKEVTFFACDEVSAARAFTAAEAPKPLRGKTPLLPPRFVDLVLKTAGEGDLWITDEWFAASVDTGVTLFSAVPTGSDIKTFEAVFADAAKNKGKAVPLPKTWWGALNRAAVLLSGEKDAPAALSIAAGKATLSSLSSYGAGRDSFKLEGAHPDTEVRISPDIALRPGRGEAKLVTSFFVAEGPKLAMFSDDGFAFVVASGS